MHSRKRNANIGRLSWIEKQSSSPKSVSMYPKVVVFDVDGSRLDTVFQPQNGESANLFADSLVRWRTTGSQDS